MSAAPTLFVDSWRRRKSAAFDLMHNSTGRSTVEIDFAGLTRPVYSNANLSIYSRQACNARCPFCVEELRPASRGGSLIVQKKMEAQAQFDDERYFAALTRVLGLLRHFNPSVSVTGGEASKDPRLPRVLRLLQEYGARKRTITTNGSGLLDIREDRRVIDWIAQTGVCRLNISIAHPDPERNASIMGFREGLTTDCMREVIRMAQRHGVRLRFSCVLLRDSIHGKNGILEYLDFARGLGVDNVIFRQLMKTDPKTHADNFVVKYSDRHRVNLEPLLDEVSADTRFELQRQIVGYYYYVEVWKFEGMDVVFEEADLAQLEKTKQTMPAVIHELVFHPNGCLASTWQPWDGVLLP